LRRPFPAMRRPLGARQLFGNRPANLPLHERENLVILGCGWGGTELLRNIDHTKYNVTMVSPTNHMLFTSLLASTVSGTLDPRHALTSIRPLCAAKEAKYLQATCETIDPKNKSIRCKTAFEAENEEPHVFDVNYDKLVISVGSTSADFGVAGVRKYCSFMKSVRQGVTIRSDIRRLIEEASHPGHSLEKIKQLLSWVVIGGGPAGTELIGELHDFVEEDVKKIYPEIYPHVQLTLIEGNKVLGMFNDDVQARTISKFRRNKIDVKIERTKEITKDEIILGNGTKLKYALAVWCAGVQPLPFVVNMIRSKTLPLDPRGRAIYVDAALRVKDQDNSIYAMGDCAAIEDNPLAQTAQVAGQQGAYIAKSLNQLHDPDIEPPPFKYQHYGTMAYTGKGDAVIAQSGLNLFGKHANMVWRLVYWSKQASRKNMFQVPMAWWMSRTFGRDLSRF